MRISCFLLLFIFMSCDTSKDLINSVLSSDNEKIKKVIDNLDRHEIQILFTEIKRDQNNKANFVDYSFQVDDSLYFYPASTVKLPVAILALEKLNEEENLDRNSKFYIEGDSLETTFTKEIEKIFAVSDNDAYNRLFEYLGQDAINTRLKSKGINARISHRVSVENSDNITTKPLIFYLNDSTTTPTLEIINNPITALNFKKIAKGKGYVEGDSLINQPKDFSKKNYLSINSLHQIMKQLMFPELYSNEQRFHLSKSDREFLIKTMKILPKKAGYISEEYYDGYVKFFLFGDTKEDIPSHIEIYNKVGYAYGYLTDCAYIIDKKRNKEYIITATIHVNENGIFNDDTYEYESIGIPFLAELGRQLVLH